MRLIAMTARTARARSGAQARSPYDLGVGIGTGP